MVPTCDTETAGVDNWRIERLGNYRMNTRGLRLCAARLSKNIQTSYLLITISSSFQV